MGSSKHIVVRHNVRVQTLDVARQRPDVKLAWWVARRVPAMRAKAERYALKHHRCGRIIGDTSTHNLVVDTGFTGLANLFLGLASENAFVYQAVGTDDTAPSALDATLGGEIATSGLARKTADAKSVVLGITAQLGESLFVNNSGGTITVEESGIFNLKGTMFARLLTGTKELLPGQGLLITHQVTFSEVTP